MINIIKNGIKKEIKALNSILENVNIKKIKAIQIDISNNITLDLNLPSKKSFIYVIKAINPIKEDICTGIKDIKSNCAMCRINDNFKSNKDNCLYVGSSHNIIKRISEHLGIGGSSKTYAMHLKKWWKNGAVIIEIYEVNDSDKCLQLYEDILWDYYKPILGRQGKK